MVLLFVKKNWYETCGMILYNIVMKEYYYLVPVGSVVDGVVGDGGGVGHVARLRDLHQPQHVFLTVRY